ncbi:MAG: HNH endonuclease [Acidimicrobiales bacterium]
MSVLEGAGPAGGSPLGSWLVEQACGLSGWEAAWLAALVRFDRSRDWATDGALSCADWLIGRVRLARSTAFEKLRVAHELARRPLVAEAFAAGRVSYCAAREITRAVGADPGVDAALIDLAADATVVEVRRAVRVYLLAAEQDRPPRECHRHRGLRMVGCGDGTTRFEAVLSDLEAAELAAALEARTDHDNAEHGEVSTREDFPVGGLADWEWQPWHQRQADALMDLVREHSGATCGADRYLVHVVLDASGARLLGGEPLDPTSMARVACDCASVTHFVGNAGEPLRLGRKQRVWSAAQRRAIAVRDRGRCRFPHCERTHADAHHLIAWEHGGATDVDNGILLCPHHHTMVHEGWTVTGQVNGTLVFHRPR